MTSFPSAVRDAAFTRIQAGMLGFKTYKKVPLIPLQPADLPAIGVFVLRDLGTPDGDPRVGEPRFIKTCTIAMSVMANANSDAALDGLLDTTADQIEFLLLTDASFVSFQASDPVNPGTEGFARWSRQLAYQQHGEVLVSEARLELDVLYRVSYPPVITDDLRKVHVETIPKHGEPVISADYDLEG